MSGWLKEVSSITINEVIKHKRDLISFEYSTPISLILNNLRNENILSIPIYGTIGSWIGCGGVNLVANHCQYIGIISIIDILVYLVKNLLVTSENNNLETLLNHRIIDVIGSTNESLSLWVEPPTRPLYFLLEQFCKGFFFPFLIH